MKEGTWNLNELIFCMHSEVLTPYVFVCVTAGGQFPIVVSVPDTEDNQTIVIIATDPMDGSRFNSTITIRSTG